MFSLNDVSPCRILDWSALKVETVSTFNQLKVETVSTFSELKVETVPTFNQLKVETLLVPHLLQDLGSESCKLSK